MFGGKIYIATSPNVVQSALRSRNLSFDPFSIAFAKRVLNCKTEHLNQMTHIPENDKEECYNNDMHKIYHEPLQPGPELQKMNSRVLEKITEVVNEIGSEFETKDLYMWLRDSFTMATSISMFGSRSPIALDPSLIEPLWYVDTNPIVSASFMGSMTNFSYYRDFERGLQLLMLDFFPYFTARKPALARDKLQSAFKAYFRAGHDLDDDVSPFIKRRTAIQRRYGFTSDDMGNFDISMLLVATTNAVPTLFWLLIYILSNPKLVHDLREEVSTVTTTTTNTHGARKMIINTSKFEKHCPVLCSSYQESMRLSNKNMSIRVARDDTLISSSDGTFFLPKNSILFLPSSLHTTDTGIWGSDANSFDPRRFIKKQATSAGAGEESSPAEAGADKDLKSLQKKSFFPFGGGRHLCPGRHFAFAEILGFVAVLVSGYDVAMADEDGKPAGKVAVPERKNGEFGEAVPKPVERVVVCVRRREGFEGVIWGFNTSTGGDDGDVEEK